MNIQKINEFIYTLHGMAECETPSSSNSGQYLGKFVEDNNEALKNIIKSMATTREARKIVKETLKESKKEASRYTNGYDIYAQLNENKYLTGLALRVFVLQDTGNKEIADTILSAIKENGILKDYFDFGATGKDGIANSIVKANGVQVESIIHPSVKENVINDIKDNLLQEAKLEKGGYDVFNNDLSDEETEEKFLVGESDITIDRDLEL